MLREVRSSSAIRIFILILQHGCPQKLELPFQLGQERGDFRQGPARAAFSMARATALRARPPTLAAAPLMVWACSPAAASVAGSRCASCSLSICLGMSSRKPAMISLTRSASPMQPVHESLAVEDWRSVGWQPARHRARAVFAPWPSHLFEHLGQGLRDRSAWRDNRPCPPRDSARGRPSWRGRSWR